MAAPSIARMQLLAQSSKLRNRFSLSLCNDHLFEERAERTSKSRQNPISITVARRSVTATGNILTLITLPFTDFICTLFAFRVAC
jgi:hypothetical protein